MNRRQFIIGGSLALAAVGATSLRFNKTNSMEEYESSVAATRSVLSSSSDVYELIRYATMAPNGHNTQPWRFRVSDKRIDILPDFTRRTPVVDPDDHHLFVSIGCAVENLSLAASATGKAGNIHFDAANEVSFIHGSGSSNASALFSAITKRQSTRGEYDGRSVSNNDLRALAEAGAVEGVDMVLITERSQINKISDLVLSGNSIQLADPAFMRELKSWLRFSPRQALITGDGLFTATTGNPTLPAWLGPVMFDAMFSADAENEKYARQIQSSAGIAVFAGARNDKEHWVRAGRACQRFALKATALGLKSAFINQPVEVASLRPELSSLIGMPGRRADIVMRFGYGEAMPFSARRPMSMVLA